MKVENIKNVAVIGTGVMGPDISLGFAMAGALIIGVAVGDAIHFLAKYREARGKGKSVKEALEYMITFAGARAMVVIAITWLELLRNEKDSDQNLHGLFENFILDWQKTFQSDMS